MKTYTREEVIALLNTNSPKEEAVILVLQQFTWAGTAKIAEALGWDRSNTGKRLEALLAAGRVEMVEKAYNDGRAGRPTRVWSLA